ncbi:MAG: YegS/Rv2252/BmrU family lipid kinase [Kiritimatiellia bacterium]
MTRVCIIVNTQSANGRTGRRLTELASLAKVLGDVEVRATRAQGHATELAREASTEGFDLLLCVGGDGTVNEVVNGLFDEDEVIAPGLALGVVPSGTGGDLVRSLNMPRGWREAIAAIAAGSDERVDVISGVMRGHDGHQVRRLCINVAGWGVNGEVVARVNRSSKALGGRFTFLAATISSALSYQAPIVHMSWREADGVKGTWSGRMMSGFAANGHYVGGGMLVGKGASMCDGVVEMLVLPPLSPIQTLSSMRRLYDGSVRGLAGVQHAAVRWLRVEAEGTTEVLVDFDGEQPGMLPLELKVLADQLTVRAPWGRS